eukprot:1648692-Pleurochrysis_carterae.AAC.1
MCNQSLHNSLVYTRSSQLHASVRRSDAIGAPLSAEGSSACARLLACSVACCGLVRANLVCVSSTGRDTIYEIVNHARPRRDEGRDRADHGRPAGERSTSTRASFTSFL